MKEKIKIEGTLEKKVPPSAYDVSGEINLAVIFERLVQLETKFDIEVSKGRKQTKVFWMIVSSLLILEFINMVFNYFMYVDQQMILAILK